MKHTVNDYGNYLTMELDIHYSMKIIGNGGYLCDAQLCHLLWEKDRCDCATEDIEMSVSKGNRTTIHYLRFNSNIIWIQE